MNKTLVFCLVSILLTVFYAQDNSYAQTSIVMTPGAGGQLYPAYVDPQIGIDGRAIVPQDTQGIIIVFDSQVNSSGAQHNTLLIPQGANFLKYDMDEEN